MKKKKERWIEKKKERKQGLALWQNKYGTYSCIALSISPFGLWFDSQSFHYIILGLWKIHPVFLKSFYCDYYVARVHNERIVLYFTGTFLRKLMEK